MKDQKTWKEFYEAAIAYRDLAPWEWMHDSDIFGVQDPESGEIGYCCVMGNAGEVFALGVYPGDEGFKSYLILLNQPDDLPFEDQVALGMNQVMLKVEFVDRADLAEQDLKQVKALGLKFRGRNQWVLARFHRPGTPGWPLDANQARRLTHTLRQACEVAVRFKEDEGLLYGNEGKMLLRASKQKDVQLEWEDQYEKFKAYTVSPFPSIKPTPALVKKAKKELKQKPGALLFMHQYMRSQVKGEKGLPIVPKISLWVSYPSGMILGTEMLGPEDGMEKLEASFFKQIHKLGYIPQQIGASSVMGSQALAQLAKELGIELLVIPEEPVFKEVLKSMQMFL